MEDLFGFEEAWAQVPNKNVKDKGVHILLGNGFSIGAHGSFDYEKLYDVAREHGVPGNVERLFDRYGTTDFERVLYQLHEGAWLAAQYGVDPRAIARDYDGLKHALIHAIAEVHPTRSWDIDDDEIRRIGDFLSKFYMVGTVSYDLVLYWTMLRYMSEVKGHYNSFLDGFGADRHGGDKLPFYGPRANAKRIVCYFHGGLHLASGMGGALKRRWGMEGESLIEQARDAIEKRAYPLFVAEGTWRAKEDQIARNGYLSWARRQLQHATGTVFTFGWALGDQDEHLLRAIWSNKGITDVWVGLHEQVESPGGKALESRALRIAEQSRSARSTKTRQGKPIRVRFYDAKSVQLWSK